MSEHCHVVLRVDHLRPLVHDVHAEGAAPFVFISIGGGLDLWSHDPAAYRRLADACVQAADALEDARLGAAYQTAPVSGHT